MQYTFGQYKESADYIRGQIGGFVPETAMILGSGLGYMGDEVQSAAAVSYADIPHFKVSTAPGHKGRLVFGTLPTDRNPRVRSMPTTVYDAAGNPGGPDEL